MPRIRQKGVVTIVSLYPLPAFMRSTPSGHYEMGGAPPCETHKMEVCETCLPHVTYNLEDRTQGEDNGFDKRTFYQIDAEDLAADLIRDTHGVFFIPEGKPSKEQLVEARQDLILWFKEQLKEADDAWNRWHDRKMIPEAARIASRVLGYQREWLTDTTEKKDCPSCGKALNPNVVRCECGAVFDWQKAFELGMLTQLQEERGIAQGKINPGPTIEVAQESAPKKVSKQATA